VILLVGAVHEELHFWQRRDGVETLIAGVGPIEASCAVSAALARRRYDLVVNAGIAGALDGARIGDGVVVADDEIELDRENGDPLALPLGAEIVARATSDAELVARLIERGFPALRGITVTRVTASNATARRLRARGAQVESMEGFAMLRAAARAQVPAIELRGISNRCGDQASSGWDFGAGIAGLRRVADALFEIVAVGKMNQ